LGEDFRQRERIKRKKQRWVNRLTALPVLERQALLSAMKEIEPGALPPDMTMPVRFASSDEAIENRRS
jgi:hypothetical protein